MARQPPPNRPPALRRGPFQGLATKGRGHQEGAENARAVLRQFADWRKKKKKKPVRPSTTHREEAGHHVKLGKPGYQWFDARPLNPLVPRHHGPLGGLRRR